MSLGILTAGRTCEAGQDLATRGFSCSAFAETISRKVEVVLFAEPILQVQAATELAVIMASATENCLDIAEITETAVSLVIARNQGVTASQVLEVIFVEETAENAVEIDEEDC